MEDAKYLDLMAKYLSGNLADSERQELFSWVERDARNRTFFDEIIQLWSISGEYEDDAFETDTSTAWGSFEKRLQASPKPENLGIPSENGFSSGHDSPEAAPAPLMVQWRSSGAWLRYAAAIALLIGLGFGWYDDPLYLWTSQYITEAGETTSVTLPDGSEVTLNASTRLTYREWWGKRQVYMAGEAFFDVERLEEQPFEILSGLARTVVLGTAFNVRAYPEEERIEVTVERGTVRVEERKSPREKQVETVLLEAGRSAVLDKQSQELHASEEPLTNATAWKTGVLEFDDIPMEDVIQVLQRVYKVNIDVENEAILRCPVFSTFINQPLESVMERIDVLFEEIDFRETSDGAYRLSGKGCQD